MGHIIIVTHGTAGDILPLCGLASGLHERGHEVVMLTHSPYWALADTGYPARAANQLRDDDPKDAVSAVAEVLEGLLAVTSGAREAR
jgi:hypothetical protein